MRRQEEHPTARELAAFLRAELEIEAEAILRDHLLESRCLHCLLKLHGLVARQAEVERGDFRAGLRAPLDSAERSRRLLRVARQVEHRAFLAEVEELLAPELLQELLLKPLKKRTDAVRGAAKYRLLGLALHAARQARELVFSDVAQARDHGDLAVEVAEWLDPAVYGRREAAAARARAWGALGNAQRVQEEFRDAECSLATARRLLSASTGDPLELADVLSLEGSLRMVQARYDEARALLEEAAAIFHRQGTLHDEAKVLVKLAKAAGEAGDPGRAVALCRAAADRIGAEGDRRLRLHALQVAATFLAESGRGSEARAAYDELAPEYLEQVPGFIGRQQLAWLGARVAWAEGNLGQAEEALQRVRAGFAEREHYYDYALASLDQARLQLEQGHETDARRLAAEMYPIFRSHDVHRHALTALLLVQRAIESGEATPERVRDVSRYLQRARHNPYLAYEPAA
ncbi:MAG TPA: hypothetical protein VM599_04275 [Thermoanaerobaculia bacterium]|nr:hypothetical protein [Thermoanaerobaculia bacterium]